jgi:hypothetical protein
MGGERMIWNLWKKIRKPEVHLVVVDLYRQEQVETMKAEQMSIQLELGFDENDSVQRWLRLHQILKDHEDRIKSLEASSK